jgi:hypothetical protein
MISAIGSPVAYWQITRTDKLHHYQTILYEIDMLQFTYERMLLPSKEGDVWVYLESFLLHYRNLIAFFGAPIRRRAPTRKVTDLTITRPHVIWSRDAGLAGRQPNEADLRCTREAGERLWHKYEDLGRHDTISRYLHHCTTYRIQAKSWTPSEMMGDIREILELIQKHLPEFKPATSSGTPFRSE